jgi:hypothetical protein
MGLRRSLRATNLVQNGNFALDSNGDGLADSWFLTPVSTKSVSNNIQSFTANSQYDRLGSNRVSVQTGDKIYGSCYFKADSTLVLFKLTANNESLNRVNVNHTGTGQFIFKSALGTVQAGDTNFSVCAEDDRASGWTEVQTMNMFMINLTSVFGAGNEPTQAQCDVIFANWYEGTMGIGSMSRNMR